MRYPTIIIAIALLATLGCGGSQAPTTDQAEAPSPHQATPEDNPHSADMGQAIGDAVHQTIQTNAEVSLDPEIANAWRAIRVRVVDLETGAESQHEIAIGEQVALGDSGLTLDALFFVPDFVMGADGITSRSPEPNNPAARVVISEPGAEDYEGWLFGAMPEIHPFPHDRYGIVLMAGVPSE